MLIRVNPSEWVVRMGWGGRFLGTAQGAAFWLWPWESYLRFPSTIQWMLFSASQITLENQGVDVKGAFSWRVVDPIKAYQNLNMAPMTPAEVKELMGSRSSTAEACAVDHGPLMRTTLLIRQLAESVTRNAIANMTLEQALRDRRAIVERLTNEIDSVIGPWGVAMTSIEIVDVFISSKDTFANMQARYREDMRRQARVVQIAADEEVSRTELEAKSRLSSSEHDQALAALNLRATRGDRELEVNRVLAEKKQAAEADIAWQKAAAEARRQKFEAEAALERQNLEHVGNLARQRDLLDLRRQRMTVLGEANDTWQRYQMMRLLPSLAQSMKADKTTILANGLGSTSLEGLLATLAAVAHTVGVPTKSGEG
ncbi:MAG TPA: SPFH domain-containing protein [Candidatus Xenobia bacterium]|jgi:regulator of protease activity HflC (stomatin/prohibitin superfamily)